MLQFSSIIKVSMQDGGIITINAGSSSVKVDIFHNGKRLMSASINGIGQDVATWSQIKSDGNKGSRFLGHMTYGEAIKHFSKWLQGYVGDNLPKAIAHRIVHGGEKYSRAVMLTGKVRADLEELTKLDPDHLPVALKMIDSLTLIFPEISQVLCFDTSFYRDLPDLARIVPLPREYRNKGMRRYGFHGLSYESILSQHREKYGSIAGKSKIIMAHLGSGASLTAVDNGTPVDTTMGLTPNSGIIMSTRSGDIDAGLPDFMKNNFTIDTEKFNEIVNKKSGLLGISGISADMYTLLQKEKESIGAKEAVLLFCHSVAKNIGALSVSLGGVDTIIFTGGIGEQSAIIRKRILKLLEFLGVKIDNERNRRGLERISHESSSVAVYVYHTDEAKVMLDQTLGLLGIGVANVE